MLARFIRFLLPLGLMHCVSARVLMMPKFYGQDSAIIVDTDKSMQSKLNPKLQNALYYNIPVYKFYKPGAGITTTTTAAPTMSIDEYPSDLLYIARNKLGLKRLDQLPRISELGELLGTGNAEQTIRYIRTLTSNDQGISLLKAYLGTLGYDQSESESEADTEPKYSEDDDNDTDNETDNSDIAVDYVEAPIKQPHLESTTKPTTSEAGGLMQHVNNFMKQYGMWSDESTTQAPARVPHQPLFIAPVTRPRPLLMRQQAPLPYHYPIPLRSASQAVKLTPPMEASTTAATPQAPMPPHLNTPKVPPTSSSTTQLPVAPHIQQLAEIANIPPAVLDTFLQQQPKLAELAKRVSRLPLVQQHSKAIYGQVLMAVKKALSQDENLMRLLTASQTLK
ncbi:hypothetical protein KR093_003368 [Drosophila rubida]|uniref:Uncharacterized protein n=1 Tax=Drosophila rubida TaxID=30044 RepID=A0AAD4K7Q0_9MUSC|nr:hypothetical protein KR093_003368 [Drosophila rubida]